MSQAGASAPSATGQQPKPFQTKLVLLGEAAVGKSSVVLRFVSNEFAENKEPTIGAAFLTQKCRLEDKIIKFEIWDTAGQERFHSLAPMYYRNAQASAVIYDVTKASSFEKAKSWIKELQRQANPNIVIALVGNKIDLLNETDTAAEGSSSSSSSRPDQAGNDDDDGEDDEDRQTDTTATAAASTPATSSLRAVPKEEAQAYADESSLLFFETSAKTGQGVIEVFTEIAKKINPQDIQQRSTSGAASGQSGTAARTGRGNVDLAEGQQNDGRRDACNC